MRTTPQFNIQVPELGDRADITQVSTALEALEDAISGNVEVVEATVSGTKLILSPIIRTTQRRSYYDGMALNFKSPVQILPNTITRVELDNLPEQIVSIPFLINAGDMVVLSYKNSRFDAVYFTVPKSSEINSNSEVNVATSKAVKLVADKTNNKLDKSGGVMTGNIQFHAGKGITDSNDEAGLYPALGDRINVSSNSNTIRIGGNQVGSNRVDNYKFGNSNSDETGGTVWSKNLRADNITGLSNSVGIHLGDGTGQVNFSSAGSSALHFGYTKKSGYKITDYSFDTPGHQADAVIHCKTVMANGKDLSSPDDRKLDKVGGTISGSLTVNRNLYVQGTDVKQELASSLQYKNFLGTESEMMSATDGIYGISQATGSTFFPARYGVLEIISFPNSKNKPGNDNTTVKTYTFKETGVNKIWYGRRILAGPFSGWKEVAMLDNGTLECKNVELRYDGAIRGVGGVELVPYGASTINFKNTETNSSVADKFFFNYSQVGSNKITDLYFGDGSNTWDGGKIHCKDVIADGFSLKNPPHQFNSNAGYQKFPSGLIIQWGFIPFGTSSSVETRTVTLPITYPHNALFSSACIFRSNDQGNGSVTAYAYENNNSQIKITRDWNGTNSTDDSSASWFSMGY